MILSLHINPCRSTIEAVATADLTGNTDWIRVDLDTDIAETLLNYPIHDEHDAVLYKYVDGVVIERTEIERMQDWPQEQEAEPTAEERLAALESIIEAQARALAALGVTGDA